MKRYVFPLLMAAAVFGLDVQDRAAAGEESFEAAATSTFVGRDRQLEVWSGSGSGTHLGQFGQVSLVQVKGFTASGMITMTAANGDALNCVFEQTLDAETGCFVGTYELTGGDGRFAGAGGSGTIISCLADDGSVTTLMSGTINN